MNGRTHLSAAILVVITISACVPVEPTDEDTADQSGELELALALDPDRPNVLQVSWRTEEESLSALSASWDGSPVLWQGTLQPGVEHRFEILGLPTSTEILIDAWSDGEELSYQGSAVTVLPALPVSVPVPRVLADLPDARDPTPYAFLTLVKQDQTVLEVVDRAGRVCWFHEVGQDALAWGSVPDPSSATVVALLQHFSSEDQPSTVERYGLRDGATLSVTEVTRAHHDLEPLPGGRVAYLVEDARPWYSEERSDWIVVIGDAIEIVELDGSVSTLMSTWDWRDPQDLPLPMNDGYGPGIDWTHANALRYRPETDSLLVSLRDLHVLIEVDVNTGAVLDEYGETERGYVTADDSLPLSEQHDASFTRDGTLLMVSTPRNDDGQPGRQTLAVEYALDEETRELVEVWSFGEGLGLFSDTRGGARRLPEGNTLIWWNDPGRQVWEVQPNGQVAWKLEPPVGWSLQGAVPFPGF